MNLLSAVEKESPEKVDELLADYEKIYSKINFGYLLLCRALEYKRINVALLLLERECCNVNDVEASKPSDTPLHYAVKLSDITLVSKLLEKQASITAIDSEGNTPLHLAFLQHDTKIIDRIIDSIKQTASDENYNNVKNQYGLSHLHIVCTRSNLTDVITKYVEKTANIEDSVDVKSNRWKGYTALHFAAKYKRLDSLNTLISLAKERISGFDQSRYKEHYGCSPLELVNRQIKKLKEIAWSLKTLHDAVAKGSKDNVELLLKGGVDVEATIIGCSTALHLAFYRANSENAGDDERAIVDLLYEALKEKIGNAQEWNDIRDGNGLSYLHMAASRDDIEMVKKFLISQDDVINAKVWINSHDFDGFSPLHFAMHYDRCGMIEFLIKQGADLRLHSARGTALHIACEHGQLHSIELLLKYDAKVDQPRNSDSKTPLQLFVQYYANFDLPNKEAATKILKLMEKLV